MGNYVDSESPGITYSSNWGYTRDGDRRNVGYYNPQSSDSAASLVAEFAVTGGTKASVLAAKGTQGGHVDVYLDGVYKATINLYNATDVWSADVWTSARLSAGTHTIQLQKTSTGRDVYFDAIHIHS